MMYLTYIGMILIVLSWVTQVVALSDSKSGKKKSKKKNTNEISKYFLILQIIGVLFLVVSNFLGSLTLLGALNLASALGAVIVYSKIK